MVESNQWKLITYWTVLFGGLSFFFFSFAYFMFARQEEIQLFLPSLAVVRDTLCSPGGLSRLLGLTVTQYYNLPLFAALLNSALLVTVGFFCYGLLQRIATRGYNLLLALIPVFVLLKYHIQWNYAIDGTFALCWMLLLLYLFSIVNLKKQYLIMYVLFSPIVLYVVAGQLVWLYTVLLLVYAFLIGKRSAFLLLTVLVGTVLVLLDIRYYLALPLTEGLKAVSFHEIRLEPDSYIYYVWIRFTTFLIILLISTRLLKMIRWEGHINKLSLTFGVGILVILFMGTCLPNAYDVHIRMIDQLSFWSRQKNWDAIIGMHYGKKIPGLINQNYLNLALSQKGVLASRLFFFDQHGPQGLLMPYDQSYRMSVLLCDIYFHIGDISTAETYAMEALTSARRGGGPRILQRLVEINLVKHEWAVANKYLRILAQMPHYRDWSAHYQSYIEHPDLITADPELSTKRLIAASEDNLLTLTDMDTLWGRYLKMDYQEGHVGVTYLGCSYLLAKEMTKFKALLYQIGNDSKFEPLPLHFQEAAVQMMTEDSTLAKVIQVDKEVHDRYAHFLQAVNQTKQQGESGLSALYQAYGNTLWFYLQFKQMSSSKSLP